MDSLRQYVLSIIGAAMVCGVVLGIAPKGTMQVYIKLLCGLFLTVSLLYPLTELDWNALTEEFSFFHREDAEEAAALGEDFSRNALSTIIKAEAEEYILDKAAALDVSVEADVRLTEEDIPVPMAVTICGEVDSASRERLEWIIQEELGISKENQLWMQKSSGKN